MRKKVEEMLSTDNGRARDLEEGRYLNLQQQRKVLKSARDRRYYQKNRDSQEWRARRSGALKIPKKPIDPQRMKTLRALLEAVFELEPWDTARHGKNTGNKWRECGERAPGFFTGKSRTPPNTFIRQSVYRMARQLNASQNVAQKWSPEVVQMAEAVTAKLAAEPRFKGRFSRPTEKQGREEPGLSQQQEPEHDQPRETVVASA